MKWFVLFLLMSTAGVAQELFFHEEFNGLDHWEPLLFPKIEQRSSYHTTNGVLVAQSQASASGLRFLKTFNVYDYSTLRWRWKISNVFEKGDARHKAGDDYPIRIYIVVNYHPEQAGFSTRLKYNVAKLFYGEYPPHSSLSYIWSNRSPVDLVVSSPYTDRAQMIPLQVGSVHAGVWMEESVNVLEDYKRAFGGLPPQEASLVIMTDSDNTKESATAWIDFIEVAQ